MNIKKEMFGKDRILSEVNGAIHDGQLSPKALIDRMTQAVHNYVGDVEQSDDLTMLAINYLK
jgi:sigma-B regulation protein RsbU (phosphoserine phosphatase)